MILSENPMTIESDNIMDIKVLETVKGREDGFQYGGEAKSEDLGAGAPLLARPAV